MIIKAQYKRRILKEAEFVDRKEKIASRKIIEKITPLFPSTDDNLKLK
jgi:hypothetical protein